MKISNGVYYAGRVFQLIALIAMPSAIWVGWIGHSERGSIAIFVSAILVFSLGTFFVKLSGKI